MPINRGAVSAIAGYVQEQRKREDEAHKSDQEFQQRLYEAGLKQELEAGRAGLNLQTGLVEARTPQRFDPSTLSPGQSYSQKVEGGTLTSSRPFSDGANALIMPEEPPRNRVIPQALSAMAGPSFAGFPGISDLLNATRLTRSAAGLSRPTPMPQTSPVSQVSAGRESPVRTATDTQTGRKVGQRRDGSLYYLDTGEPYVE